MCLLVGPAVVKVSLCVFAAAVIFLLGIVIGVTFFGVHESEPRPWEVLTQSSVDAASEPAAVRRAQMLRGPSTDETAPSTADIVRGAAGPTPAPAAAGGNDGNKVAAALYPEAWFAFNGEQRLESTVPFLETDTVSVLAWVQLPPEAMDIQTIASNRASGCSPASSRYGWSFFVNSWQTNDFKLRLDWGSSTDGCHALAVEKTDTLTPDAWYYVGFTISGGVTTDGFVKLYVNGKEAAHTAMSAGDRALQLTTNIQFGQFVDGKFGYFGYLAHIVVLNKAVTLDQVAHAMQARRARLLQLTLRWL